MNNLGFWSAGAIGLIISVFDSGIFGMIINGWKTRKEDLEVDWETLEKAERELKS